MSRTPGKTLRERSFVTNAHPNPRRTMFSKPMAKVMTAFALGVVLCLGAWSAASADAKTVRLGGGAVAFEIVGEVNNSAPGIVPATSEIFGYLSDVPGIALVFSDSDPTHQHESTALLT